jgi:hypothetical protein
MPGGLLAEVAGDRLADTFRRAGGSVLDRGAYLRLAAANMA